MLGFIPAACKYTEIFMELFAVMKFLLMAANRLEFEAIPWLELQSALHEFTRALKTESANETVIEEKLLDFSLFNICRYNPVFHLLALPHLPRAGWGLEKDKEQQGKVG